MPPSRRRNHQRRRGASFGAARRVAQKKCKERETKVYGRHAVHAFFQQRPHDLVRAFLTERTAQEFAHIMRHCAHHRLPYRILADQELERVSGSSHHQGVCVIARPRVSLTVGEWLRRVESESTLLGIVLTEVDNPHNIGAALRCAGHFGVDGVFISSPSQASSGASYRIAEGGGEYCPLVTFTGSPEELGLLKDHEFGLISTSSHRGGPLSRTSLPQKTLFLLGNETHGLSDTLESYATQSVTIEGTGYVESLNVSVATALLCAEFRRYYPWRESSSS